MWTSLLSFGKSYYLYIIGSALVLLVLGYGYYVYSDRAKLKVALDGALQANAQQHATVEAQKDQIKQNLTTCDQRLKDKESECDKLQATDDLTLTSEVSTHETTTISSSSLLNALNNRWLP